jgi:hypothetical protein
MTREQRLALVLEGKPLLRAVLDKVNEAMGPLRDLKPRGQLESEELCIALALQMRNTRRAAGEAQPDVGSLSDGFSP